MSNATTLLPTEEAVLASWPLSALRLGTHRLALAPVADDQIDELAELASGGIHSVAVHQRVTPRVREARVPPNGTRRDVVRGVNVEAILYRLTRDVLPDVQLDACYAASVFTS